MVSLCILSYTFTAVLWMKQKHFKKFLKSSENNELLLLVHPRGDTCIKLPFSNTLEENISNFSNIVQMNEGSLTYSFSRPKEDFLNECSAVSLSDWVFSALRCAFEIYNRESSIFDLLPYFVEKL